MFVLEPQSRTPIYEQMMKQVTELVLLGVLQTDEQLPSVRSLARELGINPNTVQKAYQELEHNGVVYSVTGKGSFVAKCAGQNAALLQRAEEKLREALNHARLSGMTREAVLTCTDEIFGEGTKHD